MKKLILSLFIIFATLNGFSTIYYWVGGSAATLGSSTSLSTIGVGGAATGSTVTFTSADVVIFDGSDISSTAGLQTGTITLTAPSGATVNFGQIKFQNGATITMALGGTRTWNINGLAGSDDFIIPSGCSFTTTGSTYTIAVLTGATALVNGTFTLGNNNNPHIITAADAGSVVFGSGAVFTQGTSSGGAFGTSGTTGGVVFNSGATFIHLTGANPFQTAGGLVIFNSGSLYKITGASIAPSMSGRTYGNIEYAGSGTSTSSGGSALSFENLTVTTGTANINMTGGVNIKGNISVASGSTLTFTPASSSTYTFNGTTAQTISKSGTLTFASNANVVIANTTSTVSVNNAQTFSGSMTVNSGATLIANGVTVTLAGTPAINGTFQINQGGFASGGTWAYGASGTLIFNNNSGSYGVNNDAYWPAASGPVNVTVQGTPGAGGITMNVARTVSGIFQTAGPVSGGSALTLNGTAQINAGGSFSTAPVYGASSNLTYNTGGTYGRGTEWSATGVGTIGTTAGYPNDVILANSTTLNLPNGSNNSRACNRDLTIGTGSALYADYSGGSVNLTVGRHISIAGNLSLGSGVGGDLNVGGNWTHTTGAFAPNSRAVAFNAATGDQTITKSGGETFAYLTINKAAGNVILANDIIVNNTLTLTSGIIDARTNSAKLIIPSGGNISRTSGHINGNLQMYVTTGATSLDFAIGDATNYTPVSVNFASVTSAGDLSAITTGSEQPNIGTSYLDNTKSVNRYWSLNNSGIVFSNYDATFNFVAGDVDGGASTSAFSIGKYSGGTWTYPTVGTLAVNYSIITGVTSFSDFAIAERHTMDWTGASSTAWNTAANWGGGVPASGKNVVIPTGLSNYPVLDISPTVTNVNLGSGATVSINGQTLTINGAVSGSGTITGSSSSNLIIGGTAGTIQFTSGSTNNYLKDLIVNASSSMTIGSNSLNITGGATPGTVTVNGTLNTGGYLVLKSNSSGTARVGNSSGTISGLVTVERHIPARRAWRLLAPPITSSGAPTINASWQEGQTQTSPSPALDNNPGFGTHVTGGVTGDGFDQSPSNGSSIKYLSGGSWTNVGATNTGVITDQLAYMLFVRGSRAIDLSAGIAATPDETVLRVKGNIKQGPQTLPLAATGYNLVVNPYPSAIDMHSIALANSGLINDNFKIWDPKIGGSNNVGGYVTVSRNGGNYDYAPDSRPSMSGTGSELSQYIQSGSAFFVDAISTGDVNVVESNKSASGSDNVNNPTTPDERMRVNLRSVNADATTPVVDGVLATYDAANTNAINGNDAGKLANFSTENLGMMRDGKELSIERREIIGARDTIFLNMANMKQKNYQMEMTAQLLNHPNLLGYLEDSYLSTSTLLNLDGNTIYPFNVNATPASAAANRFMIVFKPNVPLPVTFTSIKAVQQANDIAVEWKVENQTNIKQYEVEKSLDGRSFTNVGTQMATGANGTAATYNWLDVHAVSGDNFYRVKSVGLSGEVQYTRIVKVRMGKGVPAITVYPNPVTDRIVTVQFTDMAKGNYTLNLVNNLGQTVQSKLISHNGANAAQSFAIDRGVAKGNYQLQVVKPGGEKEVMKLVIAE